MSASVAHRSSSHRRERSASGHVHALLLRSHAPARGVSGCESGPERRRTYGIRFTRRSGEMGRCVAGGVSARPYRREASRGARLCRRPRLSAGRLDAAAAIRRELRLRERRSHCRRRHGGHVRRDLSESRLLHRCAGLLSRQHGGHPAERVRSVSRRADAAGRLRLHPSTSKPPTLSTSRREFRSCAATARGRMRPRRCASARRCGVPTPNVELTAAYVHAQPDDVLRAAGGSTTDYWLAQLALKL